MAKEVEKRVSRLGNIEVEYVSVDDLSPNSYNPNRQTDRDFQLLLSSMRDDGFCVASETPVLCADLVWRPAGSLRAGDQLVAFDAESPGKRGRRFRVAEVTSNGLMQDDLMMVETLAGRVFCNADHPWLVRWPNAQNIRGWVKTRDLRPGVDRVIRLFEPWDTDTSWEAGWLAGMMDGEGSLSVDLQRGDTTYHRLAVYQRPGPTADHLVDAMTARVPAKVLTQDRTASNPDWSDMTMVRVDRLGDIMRMLGSVRPPRLMAVGAALWEGRTLIGETHPVLAVEPAGQGEIASLATTTGTYIAAGYAMHNTQPVIAIRHNHEIVDGEHRWRGAIALSTDPEIGHLFKEIPVVFVDMTPEQQRIATLRHNRARGSEDVSLAAELLRDLAGRGAADFAMEKLDMAAEEMDMLLQDVRSPEVLEAPEVLAAKAADPDDNVAIADATRAAEKRINGEKEEQNWAAKARDKDIFRVDLSFTSEEWVIVKDTLGDHPADRLLAMCRARLEASQA